MISNTQIIRNIRYKDSIRINWQQAVKEAEEYTNSLLNNNDNSLDKKLDAISLLFSIKEMHDVDDVEGYLTLMDDKNIRLLLKSSNI